MTINYIKIEHYQQPVVVELEELEQLSSPEEVEEKLEELTKELNNLKAKNMGYQQILSAKELEKIELTTKNIELTNKISTMKIEEHSKNASFWSNWM